MKQTSFETRERAAELLKEAVAIWRQSVKGDMLEGLETDPVFSMLIMALAHQSNEMDADIAYLMENLWTEFTGSMVPYAVGHAKPASVMVSITPVGSSGEVEIDADDVFTLQADSQFRFIPLFRSKAIGADLQSVRRLDGRRWELQLNLSRDVNDLNGFAFAVSGNDFGDVRLYYGEKELNIVRPSDFADVPFSEPFSLSHMLHSYSPMYNSSIGSMELFAVQDHKLYMVSDKTALMEEGSTSLNLVLEFEGVNRNFEFDRSRLVINAVVLVNAEVNNTVLSKEHPFERIPDGHHLMHLLHLSDEQLFGSDHVREVRTGGDRFTKASLLSLLDCILNKFNTDYVSFGMHDAKELDETMLVLSQQVHKLRTMVNSTSDTDAVTGTYLVVTQSTLLSDKSFNIPLQYVTTSGPQVNEALSGEINFLVPAALDQAAVSVVGSPVPGEAPVNGGFQQEALARYHMATNDRIVTPADIKIFCRTRLMVAYSIVDQMINDITVKTLIDKDVRPFRYVTRVRISLADNRFVRKSFEDNIPVVETLMSRMLAVRSAGVYPIEVKITID